jgi:hypothetical protein
MSPAIAATRHDSGSTVEQSRPAPRYRHFVVAGQVISEPVDRLRFDTAGRIFVPSLPR